MKPLPMPIRIAAGLVVTALEEAQELPRKLTELPVTAVSQALQASMRLQQRVTELAIKGDRALGSLRAVPEAPEWARFDEDEEPPARPNALVNGLRGPLSGPPKVTPVRILPDLDEDEDVAEVLPSPRTPPEPTDSLDSVEPPVQAEPKPEPKPTPKSEPAPRPEPESRAKPAPKPDSSKAKPAAKRKSGPPKSEPPTPRRATSGPPKSEPPSPRLPKTAEQPPTGGPPGLGEYEQWSLPQLRGRFRNLSLAQLEALLAWETSHRDRPPYVTMLSNRIASVSGR